MNKLVLLFVLVALSIAYVSAQNAPLTLGVPSSVTFVEAEKYSYFSLPAPAQAPPQGQFLVFILTPLSAGDADLYVSTTTTQPTIDSFQWKSVGQNGLDIVSIASTEYVQSAYHIGVRGYRFDTSFTITAYYTSDYITIEDGIPQISNVNNTYIYFKYRVATPGTFTISDTAISGNTDIYVSTTNERPTKESYEWAQELEGSDILQITHSAAEAKWYYIGIKSNAYAAFSLATTHQETIAHVAEGYPLREVVSGNTYQYFKFNLTVLSSITITATKRSTFGDPDIYVSTTTERPTATNYQWRSFNYGSDQMTILAGSPNFKLGYFYIGIRDDSYFAVTLDLVVKTDKSQMLLTSGRSVAAQSEQGKYDYYKFFYSAPLIDEGLDIVATASNGRVQVVASKTEAFPTLENAQYIGAVVSGGSAAIKINPVPTGWYYIGVYSYTAANYSIVASATDDPIYLVDAKPTSYTVDQGHLKPFVFDIADNSLDVSFTLQSQSGDPDLYVGITPRTYTWHSIQGYGTDIITIASTDPNRFAPVFLRDKRFYVYVHGFVRSSFTLTAYMGNSTVELLNGVPIGGSVTYSNYVYYRYFMTNPGRLSINLQVLFGSGDADLYVSRRTSKPTSQLFDYKSTRYGPDFLTIDAAAGYYWIGVYGFSRPNTSFIISASADYETLSTNGLSIIDSVPRGTYRYYQVSTSTTAGSLFAGVTLISGATQLFAMNNGSFPSSSSYTRRDLSWPGNVLSVASTEPEWRAGTWILGVYGVDDSLYYIHSALLPTYSGILRAGEPKIGLASDTQFTYFKFAETTNVNKNYTLNVAFLSYSPYAKLGIYIDQEPNFPTATANKWSAEVTTDSLVTISSDRFVGGSAIVIATKSLGDPRATRFARFQLTLAAQDEPVFLTQEQPHEVNAEAGKAYEFEVYSPRDATGLHIYVASCSDVLPPKFYVSRTNKHPTAADHEFESTTFSKFRQFLLTDTAVPNTLYYIATEPLTSASKFTIFAYMKNDLRPQPGDGGNLNVIGTVAVGEVQVEIPAVTAGHSPFQYNLYKRVLQAGESADNINMETICAAQTMGTLVARADVPPNLPPVVYANVPVSYEEKCIVNVVAEDFYKLKAVYKPLYFVSDPENMLRRGFAMRATVNATSFVKFYLPPVPEMDTTIFLRIIVTPLCGDVDIYVSSKGIPTPQEYEWKGTRAGFDIISISVSDQHFTQQSAYHIAVYGVSSEANNDQVENSEFSILAYMSNENVTMYDGQPQIAVTDSYSFTYFNYYLDDNSSFALSATPLYGDPDVYVSTTNQKPSRYDYHWYSQSAGLDILPIASNDPLYKGESDYYIGAYGFTSTIYSLTATKENSILHLQEGIPQAGMVKSRQYTYYQFKLTQRRGLTITVTPLTTDGDPDIFVSTFWTRPTSFRSEWSASSQGDDTLVISPEDPRWIMGTYYIAVRGFLHDVKFQILVISSQSSLLAIDGLPQTISSRPGQWTFYRYYHGYAENVIAFTATPRSTESNTVEMYLSRTVTHPSSGKCDKRYEMQGQISYIEIPKASDIGWYYLGLFTPLGCNYTFVATSTQTPLMLVDGYISVQNYVPNRYYKYFVFTMPFQFDGLDVTIATNVEYGDPDLFISTNSSRPTSTDYMWKSDHANADSITIHANEIPLTARRIFVGAYGYSATRFTILAFTSNKTQNLLDSTATPGRVQPFRYNHYVYELKHTGRLKFTLQVSSGGVADVDLYVSLNKPNPSQMQYDWKSNKYGMDFIILEPAQPGKYYIAVHGQGAAASYVLTASTEYEFLVDGQALIEFTAAGTYRQYRATIDEFSRHVLAAVTMINGRTELYACYNCTTVTRETATFKATQWPGNALYVARGNPQFNTGEWNFAVYAVENADYFISLQTREGRLEAGLPRRGASVDGRIVFYAYTLTEALIEDIFVNIKVFNAEGCVNVYMSQEHNHPNSTNSKWKGRSDPLFENQSIIRISKTELQFYKLLYIGVESCSAQVRTDYEIVVSSAAEPMYLSQDFSDIFPYKQATNFAMLSAKHAEQLYMEVSSCTDKQVINQQVNMYVTSNSTNKNPTQKTAEFIGVSNGNNYMLQVKSKTIIPNNVYYMSVQAANADDLVFSVFTSTRLSDPRPHVGALAPMGSDATALKATLVNYQSATNANLFKLYFFGASIRPEQTQLQYQVVALQLPSATAKANMDTVCAMRYNKNVKYLKIVRANVTNDALVNINIELPSNDNNYLVNVIAVDGDGLESAYTPLLILSSSNSFSYQWFSIGTTLVLVTLVAFILYLIIGSLINFFRFKLRGLAIIPHINFWTDLPMLVIDGVKFAFNCCRLPQTYATFVDEETAPNDKEDLDNGDNPFKLEQVNNQQQETNRGAYGAI